MLRWLVLAGVALAAYGYEIFGFHLTIDEEVAAFEGLKWRAWISQGRWAMALLNLVVMPSPVTPVVSTMLGVVGITVGLMFLMEDVARPDDVGPLAVACMASTVPTLAFTLTFATIAYGLGFAFLALSVSHRYLQRPTPMSLPAACALGGFCIGVYQTFVFALAMLAMHYASDLQSTGIRTVLRVRNAVLYVAGSVLVYFAVSWVALQVTSTQVEYVAQFLDLHGFVSNPGARLVASTRHVSDTMQLSSAAFGLRSPWLANAVALGVICAIAYPLAGRRFSVLGGAALTIASVAAIVIGADALTPGGAPLRSQVYLPVAVALIMGPAYSLAGRAGRYALAVLCFLAVIGNAQVTNHLFASSASAEFRDRQLAQEIFTKVVPSHPSAAMGVPLKLEVVGNLAWPATPLQTHSETFGASFFEWDGGNRHRIAYYLRLRGLWVTGASEGDRVRVYERAKMMPSWPQDGWLQMEGDVIVMKFGPYSAAQKASLCVAGSSEACK